MVWNFMRKLFQGALFCLKENSVDSLLWLVDIVPSLAGFSIRKRKISAPFWIIHLSMLFYVYFMGNLVYQIYHAQGANEFVKSYVNISLLILITNNSYWFLAKRSLLLKVLRNVKESDVLAKQNGLLGRKYKKLISKIKIILFVFYGANLTNAVLVYMPHRVDIDNDFSMTPCFGLEPLGKSPNREVCLTILCLQEMSIMTVVLNYQALLLLLIAHTAAVYTMMSAEIMLFNAKDLQVSGVQDKLAVIIRRHVINLKVVDQLKKLYSIPIGINFGSNAVCISLFFYLPIRECLAFMPILVYCFSVFFLYCFLCQKLVDASEVFETAVYSCGWEKFNVQDKKTIYVMLLQAQKKVDIMAAGIVPVNIRTFASTCQAMFKFVTVVKV